MRTEDEVERFRLLSRADTIHACECKGDNLDCECHTRHEIAVASYEAGIPRDFWFTKKSDVKWNCEIFTELILPYCRKLKRARVKGYGLLFLGDNGVGKTMFISYVLGRVIRRGFTAFYTSLPELDYELKRGFKDKELTDRLHWYLTSDFVAIDEMGKEQFKKGDSWIRLQIERILKTRFDESLPTLIATNTESEELKKVYGATLTSIFDGKYRQAQFDAGDFRLELRDRMKSDLGF